MAAKRPNEEETLKQALEAFLRTRTDGPTVNQVDQRPELHISGTEAYIPSYTRLLMDEANGGPVAAIETKTDRAGKRIFIFPAKDPSAKTARKLRGDSTMGPAFFAIGVPLRALHVRIPVSRRVVLPLTPLEVPDFGTVYWTSLADLEKENRNIDKESATVKLTKRVRAAAQQEIAAASTETPAE